MWIAKVSRRECFEVYLGSIKIIETRVNTFTQIKLNNENDILLIWDTDPRKNFSFPVLVIVGDEDVKSLLTSIKASPQVPQPLSAISRVIGQKEARQHFDAESFFTDKAIYSVIAMLSLIEGTLHSDGKIGFQQLNPLLCKRTFAYAWGKAMAAQVNADSFLELPARWLEVYSILNTQMALNNAQRTVSYLTDGLTLITQLAFGIKPSQPSGLLAYSLLKGDKDGQERAWRNLTTYLSRSLSIEAIQSMAREDRGLLLQEALRALTNAKGRAEHDTLISACAFLATRLAPGGLDHFETLKSMALPELLVWYALYATLQHPKEILSLHSGLGFRILRDLLRSEDKLAAPISDMSYMELKIMARSGLEGIVGMSAHASELEVELIPYVSSSFTFQHRNRPRDDERQHSFDMVPTNIRMSPREQATRLAFELSQLAKDLPDYPDDYSSRKNTRRKL